MTIIERPAHKNCFGPRRKGASPLFVIYHDIGGSAEGALQWFENPKSRVSAHYVVARDGRVWRCVPEDAAAWHAGMSEFMGYENINDWSIGIELEDRDDSGSDPYPDTQMGALIELAEDLSRRYRIPLNRHVGHRDVATPRGRKADPGPDFPWYDFLNVLGARLAVKP